MSSSMATEAAMLAVRDPARPATIVARYPVATPEQVDAAVARSARAADAWGRTPVPTRVQQVGRWLDAIAASAPQMAAAITSEQGKPLMEARGEVDKALREARTMCAFALGHGGETLPAGRVGHQNFTLRRPRGVVLAISPWNFPLLTPLRKCVPALVAGNAVLLKPSEFTPGAALLLLELAATHLPEGVLQVVTGAAEVAARLCRQPEVQAITFTGSVEVGRLVAQAAAARLVPVSLELGGKNAAWIDEVQDLESALDAISDSAFQCAGQRCTAVSRVLAPRARLEAVLEGLVRRARALRAGCGSDETTGIGPLTTAGQLAKVQDLLAQAVARGARVECGGVAMEVASCPGGYFHAPTVLVCEDPSNPAVQEEIFGPVLTVQPYEDTDEALRLLNGVRYGLTSCLFSDRMHVVARYLAEARTGMLHVNHGTAPDDNLPFVGIGQSGLGTGSVGKSTLDFFTTEHAACVHAKEPPPSC